ncbi:MAG: hypothetical protein CSYNP_00854 [Syntrophus sp. SKADARSKE-3]|nr:hypothetical protein [Syntrophus sp. SKADARSKE-3]
MRIKWHWVAGMAVITIFLALLAFRLELFNRTSIDQSHAVGVRNAPIAEAHETWMAIAQQGRKIGYSHRTLTPTDAGYDFAEDVFMRINTMGVVQGVTLSTRGTLHRDFSLETFHVRLTSNMFRFIARGTRVGKNLTLYVGQGAEEKKYNLTLQGIPYLSGNIADAAMTAASGGENARTLNVFDPASLGARPAKVSRQGEEVLSIEGRAQKLTKWSVDFMGARQYAWVDEQGQVVREEGLLGLSLERTTRESALAGLSGASADMTQAASVGSPVTIQEPEALQTLSVRLGGIDAGRFYLNGGRQSYRDGVLIIHRESPAGKGAVSEMPDSGTREKFLQSTPFVQADHPKIRAALAPIVGPHESPFVKARKIIHFVYGYLDKQPVLSVSNAVETLARRKGDCTEHAVLVAALGRAAGIPTTIETGLVYQRNRFYYHAWNVFWIDEWQQWVTGDAVFDQMPADVTHLRFVRGEAQDQLDMIGLLGRLTLTAP